ncbi:MAG: cobalt-precorrin-5B (C(1))-methyltransferase CbiD [Desulfobacterota bacterium]|nr:cobalt-precorrin-5B (C(1))-methyltransferase CbiD [Thermodesulfobacteriota bacterium]
MKKKLATGYTTGTCAAAAARGALLYLFNNDMKMIIVRLPDGSDAYVQPLNWGKTVTGAFCEVQKDAGDDADVTHGAIIRADVRLISGSGVYVVGGTGVGVVTQPGLPVPVGMPAINPVPRRMIQEAVQSLLPRSSGIEITVSVHDGERIARKTFNPRLGIVGGISILGTTGIVIPYSTDAYRETIRCALDVAAAVKVPAVVLSTGRSSERAAQKVHRFLPEQAFILMGDYVRDSVAEALRRGIDRIIIACYPGKLLKIASGVACTHVRSAKIDMELLTEIGEAAGIGPRILSRLRAATTVRHAIEQLTTKNAKRLCSVLALRALRQFTESERQLRDMEITVISYTDDLLVRVCMGPCR